MNAKTPSSFPVRYGWMGTSSKAISNTSPLLELQKLYKIDEQERRMIESKYPTLQTSNRVGIKRIRQKIQSLYDNFVTEKWIPTIISQIKTNLYYYIAELKKMGLPFGQINEYQSKLTIFHSYFGSNCPNFSLINHRIFNKIVNNRSYLFLSEENNLLSNNKNLQSFFTVRNTILNTLYKIKSGQLQENYEKSELNPFEDVEAFIKRKIENISKDIKTLFSHLNESIQFTSEALFLGILREEDKENPKNLERFPLAVKEVKRALNEKTLSLQIEFKQWFDKDFQELFIFDKKNPFEIIKFRYAPMLITQPDLLEKDTSHRYNHNPKDYMKDIYWSWTNPSKYQEFIELMLYQYFQYFRNSFSNVMKDILIPENAFKTDSDIPRRDQYLTNLTIYIEVIGELKKLNTKD